MKITIFNKATGAISRVVSCPVGMGSMQLADDSEDFISGEFQDDLFRVANYLPVPLSGDNPESKE